MSKLPQLLFFVVVVTGNSVGIFAEDGKPPRGLVAVPVPKDNPQTAEKVALGKQLYFDKRLSATIRFRARVAMIRKKGGRMVTRRLRVSVVSVVAEVLRR